MIQLIAFIIFIVSASGIFYILFKKKSELVMLPRNGSFEFSKPDIVVDVYQKVKEKYVHFFQKQMFLHKILSWIKVLTLKIERNIDNLLHGIRKKAQVLDKEAQKKTKK